jgi:hypothetical protein
MTIVRLLCAAVITCAITSANAQEHEFPKPGKEHALLKQREGTWDATMNAMGKQEKGTYVVKMDLGGLWLTSNYEGEFMGTKFQGRGYDSYDAATKKFTGVWLDSFSTTPMTMTGTYDEAKKTMTMTGVGPGVAGPQTKHVMVTEMPDANTMNFTMFMGDQKEPAFTIVYKRKK